MYVWVDEEFIPEGFKKMGGCTIVGVFTDGSTLTEEVSYITCLGW